MAADRHTLITKIVLAAYYIDPESLVACGGHDYEEIVVSGKTAVQPDANGTFTVEQSDPASSATSPAIGQITQVGGCNTRSSMTLRPQTPLVPGDSGLVRLAVPFELPVRSAVVHETVPGTFPSESRSTPGQLRTLFVDPASIDAKEFEGWQIFYAVQASDADGRCGRKVTQVFPAAPIQ